MWGPKSGRNAELSDDSGWSEPDPIEASVEKGALMLPHAGDGDGPKVGDLLCLHDPTREPQREDPPKGWTPKAFGEIEAIQLAEGILYKAGFTSEAWRRTGASSSRAIVFHCPLMGRKHYEPKTEGMPPAKTRVHLAKKKSGTLMDRCPWGIGLSLKKAPVGSLQKFAWFLSSFHLGHNHDQATLALEAHTARMREVTPDVEASIIEMGKASVTCDQAIRMLQGQHEVKHLTEKDVLNIYAKHGYTPATDTNDFLEKLYRLEKEENWFVVADVVGGVLRRVFWMTPEQMDVAKRFGTILYHDNTYKCNRYKMSMGAFCVVNHHRNTRFAAQSLTFNETEVDYVWQFSAWLQFVRTRGGLELLAMFTDAARAATNAVEHVFPSLKDNAHFWCMWHFWKAIRSNCKSNDDSHFSRDLGRCYYQVDKTVFHALWEALLENYPQFAPYLQRWWGGALVIKWALCYQVGHFTTGSASTQRSEGMNRWAKRNIKRTVRLETAAPTHP